MQSRVLFLTLALAMARASQGQDLSGTWQGVEVHLPRADYWPAVLTITEGKGGIIAGTLEQEGGMNPTNIVRFLINGQHSGARIRLDQSKILYQTGQGYASWCQGYLDCTYNAAEERLSARSTFRPVNDCSTSSFDLFRVKLKSAAQVPAGSWSTLRISGREVVWFSDRALQHQVAKGNSFRTRLTTTTTFYITQGFYPSHKSGPVPVTVRVGPALAARKPQRAAAPLLQIAAPVALPDVLFRTGTAELLPVSEPTLLQLLQELRAHPKLRLRIAGHTDQIGDATKNLLLSEQRAEAVQRYLLGVGVAAARLETIGYGHSRLRYPSPDLRNRRVEVEVLK
ncbi:OmpA family protein [Hymenobacter sp. BT523]|uniref:OmpA family protein n=1 Tax=Hymenobacter sp. BT523 TaxID=2795725 RepID=UPI0018EE192B|nr:OmpA family protein [Hymenobacter sp. BT523]MBJ6109224.1 OmpA family protein [Hymenobacter sp. BT523]